MSESILIDEYIAYWEKGEEPAAKVLANAPNHRPEKPLKWLADFLAQKSAEVEGSS